MATTDNEESILATAGLSGARWLAVGIAGVQHHDWPGLRRARRFAEAPKPGDLLALGREPANQYDANAVAVRTADGKLMLGYIPRDVAAWLSPVLDDGGKVGAIMLAVDGSANACEPLRMVLSGDIPDGPWRRSQSEHTGELPAESALAPLD